MNVGYDIESIEKIKHHLSLKELKTIHSHLRDLVKGRKSKQEIQELVAILSEKLYILQDMAQELENQEASPSYVLTETDLQNKIFKILKRLSNPF